MSRPVVIICSGAVLFLALGFAFLAYGRRLSRNPAAHPIGRRLYPFIKWPLVLLGAYALIGTGLQSIQKGELGLGVAFILYLVNTVVVWIWEWFRPPTEPEAPSPSSRS